MWPHEKHEVLTQRLAVMFFILLVVFIFWLKLERIKNGEWPFSNAVRRGLSK